MVPLVSVPLSLSLAFGSSRVDHAIPSWPSSFRTLHHLQDLVLHVWRDGKIDSVLRDAGDETTADTGRTEKAEEQECSMEKLSIFTEQACAGRAPRRFPYARYS